MMKLNSGTLCGIEIFQGLAPSERRQLSQLCQCQHYVAGEYIVSYQDRSHNVFFVVSGRVQAINFALSGQQVTLQDLLVGQMFGELSAIDGEPRSSCVIAAEASWVAAMSADDFKQILHQYPLVAEETFKHLSRTIRYLSARVFERGVLSVNQRIRAELLRLARGDNIESNQAVISPALTHADIANYVGASRETVTRELASLKKAGLITRRGTDLVLRDVNRLSQMVRHLPDLSWAN